jgi:hypothetical protein
VILAALLLAAPTPSIPYWLYRVDPPSVVQHRLEHHLQREQDQANYEESVQEDIDNMKDGQRKDDLQDKLTSFESDENYPEYQKQDQEDIQDWYSECHDCDDPEDEGYPRHDRY